MLAESLEAMRQVVERQVVARLTADRGAATSNGAPRSSLSELIDDLCAALRRGRVEPAPLPSGEQAVALRRDDPQPGLVQTLARECGLLGDCIHDLIEQHEVEASLRDMRVLSAWLRARTCAPALALAARLGEQNRRLAALLDAVPDPLSAVSREGRICYLNRASLEVAHAVSDVPTDEIAGRRWQDLGYPSGSVRQYGEDLARASAGATVTTEILYPTPMGARWFEHKVSPIYREDGTVVSFAAISRDIDDRRRAQTRLSLLSKLGDLAGTLEYKDVLSAVARLTIPELADWCFVDVLDEGEVRIAEVACRDAAGAALANALPRLPIHHPARRKLPAAQALRSGRPVLIREYTLDLLREQTEGEYFELLRGIEARSAIAIPLNLGSSLAVMTFLVTSESERRYGPEDLALAEELARRAAQIVEQKRAQHELAQALAFREQVMGILGHDLRNPLGAVRVLAALLLRRSELPEDVRGSLAEIDRAGKRMLELIGTLLDFSESRFKGTLPIAPAPTDMHDLCRGVIEELLAAEPDRSIEIDGEGDARGAWDPARLAQVVSNLVGNALKHGARRAPVRVSVRGGEGEVVLEVQNQGPAIAPELLPVLFEPFRRGSTPREAPSHARGVGLGLYIVRQIVNAHGGTISVESTAEQGTTFTVRLPRARGVQQAAGADDLRAAWEGGAVAGP